MTRSQFSLAASEAAHYADPDAFCSDLLLSSAFLPEDEAAEPDLSHMDELRRTWTAAAAPFRDFLAALGLGQSALSRAYLIPLRTVQGWTLGERECPAYLRLMLARLEGYLQPLDD